MTRSLMREGCPVSRWSSGAALFHVDEPMGKHSACVAVSCRVEHLGVHRAMVDTGAQWSVIGGELAQALESAALETVGTMAMTTRLGTINGELCAVSITLVAQEGDDLAIEATALVAPDWTGPPVVLGHRGLLEKVRFALDPGVTQGDQWLYFGHPE